MTGAIRRAVRAHWPRMRLRTILLLTFVFVAALPGVGALFLRVYENTLVRQTESELVAQGAALAAAAAADLPGGIAAPAGYTAEPPTIDLRLSRILPERPPASTMGGRVDPAAIRWSVRLRPVLRLTAHTTLASILLLDADGRILIGPVPGLGYPQLPEVRAALAGRPATVLRRNDDYRPRYPFEWLSRASDLRIHHARPIVAGGRVVGVLLLSRSPRALFVGIYEDRGKIALGIALIFATLVLLSGLLSRGIVRPVEALGEATRAVAGGGGTVPPPPPTAAIEIQALYRDFAAMAAAIERRSRYLRDFAHAVSHEFKTPLAGIGGAVELLQDHPDMAAADRQRFLANIAADADRLALLVTRLLDLARADMTEAQEGIRCTLSPLLHRLADAHRGAGFAVRVEDAEPVSVAVAAGAVEAAVTGLIENSRQAGATTVTLTVSLSVTGDGDRIALVVADDGPGIPPGDRDRIFEPFFTSRRTHGGTGLGLPIARSLLQAYGSTIEQVDRGAGAAFRIAMPRA